MEIKLIWNKKYLLFFSCAVDEGVSGVRGNDLTDFVGDPAFDLLSASLDILVGDSASPFVLDIYLRTILIYRREIFLTQRIKIERSENFLRSKI